MNLSRRSFLTSSAALLGSSLLAHAGGNFSLTQFDAITLTNYNPTRKPVLFEGQTLLVGIMLPQAADKISGSFPVQLSIISDEGESLLEPQPLFMYATRNPRKWLTILTAPLDALNQNHSFKFAGSYQNGSKFSDAAPYFIRRGAYSSANLTLSKDFSEPSPDIVRRQREDFLEMVDILGKRTARQWTQPFMRPVTNSDSRNFGTRRTVNRTKHYRHRGLDFRAPLGTQVRAVNSGTVVLAKEQWTAGNAVCIDHGGGVFSKYIHLSRFMVNVGERVTRGQVIARSGNTGGQKVAPHLHLDFIVNGSHVDFYNFMPTAEKLLLEV